MSEKNDRTLPTLYQQFVHLSRYARWIDSENRRETWEETVDRYVNYMFDVQCCGKMPEEVKKEVREAILNLDVMPSMRCMMTAGPALDESNIAGYNCAGVIIDHLHAFDEILYILMHGAGIGFSVERQFICNLPSVAEKIRNSNSAIVVEDSKLGWAMGFRELVSCLYSGTIPKWDLSKVRPAGARLKTFGGRASGPGPLEELFRFTIATFKGSVGRKLNSIECHDICTKIAECVVVGGVRRSACISLSNLSDDRMRHAKAGEWWLTAPHRALANNSVVYTEKPDMGAFMREWVSLYDSKSGERGIVNRQALKKQVAKYGRRNPDYEFIVNPCSEVILRSCSFCNLSEIVVRENDTEETLMRKARIAAIIGTIQATLTNFPYLREVWKKNAEEEALLGVSMTGVFDNKITSGRDGKKKLADFLDKLREFVVKTNKEWALRLGINQSVATTTNKPSGTVSALVNCASGIHAQYAKYYIRRVRADKKDPMAQVMVASGFPYEDDATKPEYQWVFSFPMKAPDGAVVTDDLNALDHLDIWKIYQDHWTEHKPSITVSIRESEWMEVGAWVFKHFDSVSGVAFLPFSGHTYKQMPFTECTKDEYEKALVVMPKNVDWGSLMKFEQEDKTISSHELACSGSSCELVDLTKT